MKEEQTDFLDDFDLDAADAAIAERAPEPTGEQPRGPDGKFAVKTEAAEKGEKPSSADAFVKKAEAFLEEGAGPPAAHEEDQHVPLSVVIALRKELQALKAGKKAEQSPAQPNAQSNQPTPKSPEFAPPEIDIEDDPNGYLQSQIHSMKMQQSRFFAERESSADEVAEAWAAFDAACKTDPAVSAWSFSPALQNHQHPIGEIVKWHRTQRDMQLLQQAGGLEKLIAQRMAEAQASTGAQPALAGTAPHAGAQTQRATPLPSLANGGAGQVNAPELASEDDDFTALFEGARKPRKR